MATDARTTKTRNWEFKAKANEHFSKPRTGKRRRRFNFSNEIDNEGFAIFADKEGNDYNIIKATHREGETFARLIEKKQRMEQCFNMGGEGGRQVRFQT